MKFLALSKNKKIIMKKIITFALLALLPSVLNADQNTATLEEILANQKKLAASKDHQERLALQSRLDALFRIIEFCEKQNGNYKDEETKKGCEDTLAIKNGLIRQVIDALTKLAQ